MLIEYGSCKRKDCQLNFDSSSTPDLQMTRVMNFIFLKTVVGGQNIMVSLPPSNLIALKRLRPFI